MQLVGDLQPLEIVVQLGEINSDQPADSVPAQLALSDAPSDRVAVHAKHARSFLDGDKLMIL